MSDEEIRELFREMRDEQVPADSLVRVRDSVYRGVRRRRQWLIAAWAVTCTVALFVFLAGSRRQSAAQHPTTTTIASKTQPVVTPIPAPPRHTPVRPAIRKSVRTHGAEPQQQIAIRIETPDPDVVIVLVGDDTAERKGN